jgi:hypothetical protein
LLVHDDVEAKSIGLQLLLHTKIGASQAHAQWPEEAHRDEGSGVQFCDSPLMTDPLVVARESHNCTPDPDLRLLLDRSSSN